MRRLRMEVFEAATGKAWHRALELPYVARNSSGTGFFAFSWDGTTIGGKKVYSVPKGQYVIRLTVQKALGEDGDPAHQELDLPGDHHRPAVARVPMARPRHPSAGGPETGKPLTATPGRRPSPPHERGAPAALADAEGQLPERAGATFA